MCSRARVSFTAVGRIERFAPAPASTSRRSSSTRSRTAETPRCGSSRPSIRPAIQPRAPTRQTNDRETRLIHRNGIEEEGNMRKYLVAACFAAAVAALASVAFGSTKSPTRASSAGAATVTCGKTRTIGLAAPFTGPAAAIGNQQVRWAKYYVKRWNRQKANKNKQIKVIDGDTQLGNDTAFAVRVAKSFASNSKLLGVVGPAGSQEVVASTSAYKGGKLGFVSGS